LAATIGLGALAVASAGTEPIAQSVAAPQIDTVGLMSKAGNLPVETAPAP
jgi:hypothetical protein